MYFIRIDDLRPGMDKNILRNIISFFEKIKIKPLIAIIPKGEEDNDFWETIKDLEKQGWTIGIHGYNHKLRQNPENSKSIVPIQNYSEFVGLSYDEQNEKIKKAIKIFNKYCINPNIFIAPAHGLDDITLKILKENHIKFVSDGFFLYPKIINGIIFFPQQLWRFKKIPIGYKTICLHLEDFENLENPILKQIKENKVLLKDYSTLLNIQPEKSIKEKVLNYIFEKLWFSLLKIKRIKG